MHDALAIGHYRETAGRNAPHRQKRASAGSARRAFAITFFDFALSELGGGRNRFGLGGKLLLLRLADGADSTEVNDEGGAVHADAPEFPRAAFCVLEVAAPSGG